MNVIEWMKREVIRLLPAIIYFCIAFNLAHFTVGLVLGPNDHRLYSYGGVTVGAIIMGKIILIAESLPFLNAFPNPPLIYNIIWKTFLYNILVILFRVCESMFHLWWHYGFSAELSHLAYLELTSPIFWATLIVIGIFFFFFVLFGELVRFFGKEKVRKAIFSHDLS